MVGGLSCDHDLGQGENKVLSWKEVEWGLGKAGCREQLPEPTGKRFLLCPAPSVTPSFPSAFLQA